MVVDSGCSNRMTYIKSLFQENHMTDIKYLFQKLDETQRMRNKKEIQVEEKGIVKVETSHGKIKLLDSDTKETTIEVSLDEETRVYSSTSPSASTTTQNLSNSSSSTSLNNDSSLEEFVENLWMRHL